MNKLKVALLSAMLSVSAVTPVQAGLFDSVATSDWSTKSTTVKYKLKTYGYDVRVYEWTPKDNPNVRCVFVAGNENSSGVACYDVAKPKQK